MLIFILFFALGVAHCPEPRDNLIQCFRTLLDTNKDSIITVSEIDHFLSTQTCINENIAKHITGTIIMNTCDLNRDGQLTLSDWTMQNACVSTDQRVDMICVLCERCGWEGKRNLEEIPLKEIPQSI